MPNHPVLKHLLTTDDLTPRAISDFLTTTDYHRLDLYCEFFRPLKVEDQLTVAISRRSPERLSGISVDRDSCSFSERERQLLTRLRPHLSAAHDNALVFSRALAGPKTREAASADLDRLSERQHEILTNVARGYTNAQIALLLGISPGTVRKHVENILVRLSVPNRTAAASLLVASVRPDFVSWGAVETAFPPLRLLNSLSNET
jgi:DNA-binding CsgD family transcriptional regulator